MDLCNIKTVKGIMALHSQTFKKGLGQNFLINRAVVEDIADNCCEDASSSILEIGPGIGTLTQELCIRFPAVMALEIDRGLIPVLEDTMHDFDNLQIVNQDVMKADLDTLLKPYFERGKVSVCANLPYYITTPILMKLLESNLPFEYITIMIQTEVADRLCAKPGSSDYGAITPVLAYYGEAEQLFRVGPGNFTPPPKVTSSIVRIKLHQNKPYVPKDEAYMFRVIKAAFEQRRKTLPNALSAGFPEIPKSDLADIIVSCGFSADIRGERLSIADFVRLSDAMFEKFNK